MNFYIKVILHFTISFLLSMHRKRICIINMVKILFNFEAVGSSQSIYVYETNWFLMINHKSETNYDL